MDLQAELSTHQAQQFVDTLDALTHEETQKYCEDNFAIELPACSKLSDDFCTTLWNSSNNGNLDLGEEKILLGSTKKEALRQAQLINFQALIDGQKNLPADVKKEAEPILTQLKQHLDQEDDSKTWFRKLGQILDKFDALIEDKARARTLKRFPNLKNVKAISLTLREQAAFAEDFFNIKNAVLEAKYAKHPNWLRVKKIFEIVKADIRKTVTELKFSQEEREFILKRIDTVQLSLPYQDPRLLGQGASCGTTEVNAYYFHYLHKYTVCAGMFNSLQSDANLYLTTAHEIAHSFDPNSVIRNNFMQGNLGKTLEKMCNAEGATFSCTDWKEIKEKIFTPLNEITAPSLPYKKLNECLKPISGLNKFETRAVQGAAQQNAGINMHRYANSNFFLKLAQPSIELKDGTIKNETYLRADLLKASYQDGIPMTGSCYIFVTPELFVQELVCQNYENEPKKRRAKVFQSALAETKKLTEIINEHKYSYCGQECEDLVSRNLARNTSEDFSDFIAFPAFVSYLARENDIKKRRDMVALGLAHFCNAPSLERDAEDLSLIEKEHSFEPHADNRKRRLSLFVPSIIEQAACRPDKDLDIGAGKCAL